MSTTIPHARRLMVTAHRLQTAEGMVLGLILAGLFWTGLGLLVG